MILVTGATGFVGRHVVAQLLNRGHKVRVLARSPEKAARCSVLKGCEIVAGDVLKPETLPPACQGVRAVVHLVGIIFEHGNQTFERVHVEGTSNLINAARAAGVTRYLHMSASGTRPLSPSRYHQTKWLAEDLVRQCGMEWTIFRPSIIYGANDQFVRLFATLMEPPLSWMTGHCLPCFFEGKTRMQPVTVEAVAGAFATALARPVAVGKVYDLCGPVITFAEMLAVIARRKGLKPIMPHASFPAILFLVPALLLQGYRPVLLPVPGELARVMAFLIEHFSPVAIMNSDQILMLQEDQNGNPDPASAELDIVVPDFHDSLPPQ